VPELPSVEELLPHRGRYLLISRLLSFEGLTIEAEGSFAVEDCEGHFPDQPVVPGVLLLEGLAQTMCCVHMLTGGGEGGTPFLAGFEKVRFRAPVIPPSRVRFKVTLKEMRFGLTTASGVATVNGRRVVTARLTGVIIPPEGGQ